MNCKDCKLACYDLLDRSLSASDEAKVLAHIQDCPQCRAFLEAEGCRMRAWPRLLSVAARDVALPADAAERVAHALEVSHGKRARLPVTLRISMLRLFARPWMWAAALAILAATSALMIVSLEKPHHDAVTVHESLGSAVVELPAVRVVSQQDGSGLYVPDTLPGYVRLTSGQAVIRLLTGVELTLSGAVSLWVDNGLQVMLEQGKMLAHVPFWAQGFQVRTALLDVRDLGTVFGVTASKDGAETVVIKGAVQVTDATTGTAVGVCTAGQGVRAASLMPPQRFYAAKITAQEWLATASEEQTTPIVSAPVPGLKNSSGAITPPEQNHLQTESTSRVAIPTITTQVMAQSPAQQGSTEMKVTNSVAVLAAATILGTANSVWAIPEVTNVRMQQRASSRIVDVWYDLAGEAAIVTLGIETNSVAISDHAVTRLTGDVSVVIQPGTDKHIVWNAGADWPENVSENAKARVTAWSTNAPPLYCAVDVVGGAATNSYPVTYYPSAEGVPGGVTNDLYKTTRILMRKISATGAGGFKMGSPSNETGRESGREDWHDVVLTKAFYVGVYEITQSQWQLVMSDTPRPWPSKWNNNDYKLTRPVEQVSYYEIRENNNNTDDVAVNWPVNDAVTATSFMGRLRIKTGLAGFDLPTEAQWEYACRAGTTGALNDGTVNLTNTIADVRLNLLGRYERNGGKIWSGSAWIDPAQDCAIENGTAAVGSYQPNAWGLYDMHGNVFEWCLDWAVGSLGTGTVVDPVGPESGGSRVVRGGTWYYLASNCRSASRTYEYNPIRQYSYFGFRLVRTLP